MRYLFICLLLNVLLGAQTPDFTVEKLTPTESAAYKEAVAHLHEVERKIKAGHGENTGGVASVVTANCGPRYSRTVTIKGDYALIDIDVWNPCEAFIGTPAVPFSAPDGKARMGDNITLDSSGNLVVFPQK